MAIGRTERSLYEAALKSIEATVHALNALEYLSRDFEQGNDPDELTALGRQARELEAAIEEELSSAF